MNGYENIDRNIFPALERWTRTRGHEATLIKCRFFRLLVSQWLPCPLAPECLPWMAILLNLVKSC